MTGFVFPGQGTVRVGMGAWLRRSAAGAPVVADAEAALDLPIGEVCASGPLARLVDTAYAQPAVTACNLAALAVLRERAGGLEPQAVAGHSVGELSAWCAAGVIDADATWRLVGERSRLMAGIPATGAMVAVIGLPLTVVEELTAQVATPDEPLVVGLENAPEHVVVSGARAAVDRLVSVAGEARQLVPLEVSNAFHSPLMATVVDAWAVAVRAVPKQAPSVPVVPNATGEPSTDLATLTDALIDQLTGRVRWADSMSAMAGLGIDRLVEVGDSKALTGFARAAGLRCQSLAEPATLRRLDREPVS
ncbi:ACP S-malonyltransferase [Isoptericola croceus]|uniref:ACP S-malonyltransferase n=1 Tax=Isoptericola croceus TaxID=3031406 RepID=UPI0023F7B07E|nr:ACP S-malonyltransferase [Isoptericola croceus]